MFIFLKAVGHWPKYQVCILVAIERTELFVRLLLGAPKVKKYFRVVIRVEEGKSSPLAWVLLRSFHNPDTFWMSVFKIEQEDSSRCSLSEIVKNTYSWLCMLMPLTTIKKNNLEMVFKKGKKIDLLHLQLCNIMEWCIIFKFF